jgi:hypothetical protein
MKPRCTVDCRWTPNFAYAVGLIASDGCLQSDGRHIDFTSKDRELVRSFRKALCLPNKIGRKARGYEQEKKYYRIQFGDVNFYRFLLSIGLTPRKSKTIGKIKIPHCYFYDFLRGLVDGDGNIHEFEHPESRYLQLRVRIASASKPFLEWVREQTWRDGIRGGFFTEAPRAMYLGYAIADSKRLLNLMYYSGFEFCLKRKYLKAKPYINEPR